MSSNSVIDFPRPVKKKIDKSKWVPNIFHVDLSEAHEGEEYWLHACGRRFDLCKHTKETLRDLRANSPHLDHVPDHRLTHFTEEIVFLPHDRVVRIHIKHSLNTFDTEVESGVYHAMIHIPPKEFRPTATSGRRGNPRQPGR